MAAIACLLAKGHERLDDTGEAKLLGFLDAGDPKGEVRMAWHAKEILRGFYDQPADEADDYLADLAANLVDARFRPSSGSSAARCDAGTTRSSPGTRHRSPTDRPRQPTA